MPALDSLISALLQTAAPRSPLLLREWQSRQLAARLLLPTLLDLVRSAAPAPLNQVCSLLRALARRGSSEGRELAFVMLRWLIIELRASPVVVEPVTRATTARTTAARATLRRDRSARSFGSLARSPHTSCDRSSSRGRAAVGC